MRVCVCIHITHVAAYSYIYRAAELPFMPRMQRVKEIDGKILVLAGAVYLCCVRYYVVQYRRVSVRPFEAISRETLS